MKKKKIFFVLLIITISTMFFYENIGKIEQANNINTHNLKQAYENDLIENTNFYGVGLTEEIPDKYNTGCIGEEEFTIVDEACTYEGIVFRTYVQGEETRFLVNLQTTNAGMAKEIVIRDTTFTLPIRISNVSSLSEKKTITFENCKLAGVLIDEAPGNLEVNINNCDIAKVSGSNITIDKSYLGGTYYDCINAFVNVTATNCYFADLAHPQNPELAAIHGDGIQVWGITGTDIEDIYLYNCRMEIPGIKMTGNLSDATVNACLMIQPERSNAKNLLFEKCILNGGGYTIYAKPSGGTWALDNVVFKDIQVGNAKVYGTTHPTYPPTVTFDNVKDTNLLYVASVWKDSSGIIHLSASNDTAADRTLLIVTEQGEKTVTIPKCMKSNEIPADTPFSDMPFDIDIEAGGKSEWLLCYDITDGNNTLIRRQIFEETEVTELEIKTKPTKVEYYEGSETLDLTGAKITVTYLDGYTEEIDITNDMITGFDSAILGEQTITVTYSGQTTTFKINITEREITSIEIKSGPVKAEYTKDYEDLDLTGAKITINYSNNTSEEINITNDMVTGFDNTVLGENTVTVTYKGKITTFKVNIVKREIVSIELKSGPTKTEYIQNYENLDLTGAKIIIHYSDNTSEEINVINDMVTGFNNSMLGEQTITVTYSGKIVTFRINIIEPNTNNSNEEGNNSNTENSSNNTNNNNNNENSNNSNNINNNNSNTQNNSNNIVNNTPNNALNTDDTVHNGKLPKTGESAKIYFPTIALIIVAVISYKKYSFFKEI